MDTSASLLDRLQSCPDEASWRRLDDLYRPMIRRWLQRDPSLGNDLDDLVQEVMSVLVRELPAFRRRRAGSFRRWLREVTVHRLQNYYRQRRRQPALLEDSPLGQLAAASSELSQRWDQEHDRHVIRRLLELIQDEFQAKTLEAFRRVVFDEVSPAAAAEELGVSVNAVLIARSRVLARLREEAGAFLE